MEAVDSKPKSFFERNWVKYGLIGGGIAILITALYYLVDDTLLGNQLLTLIPSLLVLALGVYAAVAQRKDNGGYITYGEAVGVSIGSFMVSIIVSAAFSFLLFLLIDPSLQQIIKDAQVEQLDSFHDKGFIGDKDYEQGLRDVENMGPGMFIFQWSMALIFAGVIALIVYLITSIFVRREPKL